MTTMTGPTEKRYWLSFYYSPPAKGPWQFELRSPWWVSGSRGSDNAQTICCAVKADSEDDAWAKIAASFDKPSQFERCERRFCNSREPDWNPWDVADPSHTPRFQRADWMEW